MPVRYIKRWKTYLFLQRLDVAQRISTKCRVYIDQIKIKKLIPANKIEEKTKFRAFALKI